MKTATVYVIEWDNGNTDVFADRDEAMKAYAIASEDLRMRVAEDGEDVAVEDAQAPAHWCVWSSAALALV
jgi:hypothetical protein